MKKLVYDGSATGFSMMMLIEIWAHTAGECFASETDMRLPQIAWDRFTITLPPNQLAAWKGMLLSGAPLHERGAAEFGRLEAEATWVVDPQLPRTEVQVQVEGIQYRIINLSSRLTPITEPWKADPLGHMAQQQVMTKEEARLAAGLTLSARIRAQEDLERLRYEEARARAAIEDVPAPPPIRAESPLTRLLNGLAVPFTK